MLRIEPAQNIRGSFLILGSFVGHSIRIMQSKIHASDRISSRAAGITIRTTTKIVVESASVLLIIGLTAILNAGHVYAQTMVLTPNPVTQGVDVQVTGSGFQQYENAQISIYTSNAGTCATIPLMNLNANTDSNGNLEAVTIPTNGLSPGTYCVEANGFLDPPDSVDLVVNSATPGTIVAQSSSTPGYLYALPLILGVIGLAYVLANRKHQEPI